MKGVLNRYEGTDAIISVEDSHEEFTVPRATLPEGSFEGVWYHLGQRDGKYHIYSVDVEATEEKSSANAMLLENLRKKHRPPQVQST